MSNQKTHNNERERRINILTDIGKKCREHRHSLSLKMCDVSEQTGYSIAQISKFERGQSDSAVLLSMYTELTRKEAINSDEYKENL